MHLESLTLSELETPKGALWQTVKTQIKCRKTRHFTRACTVCYDKYNLREVKWEVHVHNDLEISTCDPL